MKPRRSLIIAAIVAAAAAVAWTFVAVPRLVLLPDDIDKHLTYAGTFVTFVNPGTGASLATPVEVPLTIDRHVVALDGQGDGGTALVEDEVVLAFAGREDAKSATYRIDRRTMENQPAAYTSVTAAEGTYSINLPFDADADATFQMWKADTGTSYPLRHVDGAETATINGLETLRFTGSMPATPVTDATAERFAKQGLPTSLAPDAVLARLEAAGIDIEKTTAALLGVLSDTDREAILGRLGSPVPLTYNFALDATAFVEQSTGMVVEVRDAVEQVTVAPDTSGLDEIATILAAYPQSPEAQNVRQALEQLGAAGPQPVYEVRYSQTPASVAASVEDAQDAAASKRLAERTVPGALLLVALIFVVLAFVTRRRPVAPVTAAVPADTDRPTQLAA